MPIDSLFISPKDQSAIFRKHHIEYEELDNGARIAAVSLRNPESMNANIDCHFGTGSYFDPPGKLGLHHFLEHLINKPVREISQTRDVTLNASTSFAEFGHHSRGPITSGVADYGILDMIPRIADRLARILSGYDDLDEVIDSERHVIQNEIDKYHGDHSWVAMQHIKRDLLGSNNPLLIETAGTQETLARMKRADFESLAAEICTSSILTVEAKNIGPTKHMAPLMKSLIKTYSKFPKTGLSRTVDWSIVDQHAPLPDHQTFTHKTKLKNNLSSIAFSWLVDCKELSTCSHAFGLYRDFVQERIHKYSRQQGIGYTAAIMHYQGMRKRMIIIRFDTSNHSLTQLKQMARKIEKDLIGSLLRLSREDLDTILKTHNKREHAIPYGSSWHFQWAMHGLERYGKFVSGAAMQAQNANIRSQDVQHWEQLLTSKPANAITIAGDYAQE